MTRSNKDVRSMILGLYTGRKLDAVLSGIQRRQKGGTAELSSVAGWPRGAGAALPEPMSSQDDDAAFAAIVDDAASAAVELSSGIAMLATQKPEISGVESVGRSRPRCASTVLLLLAHLRSSLDKIAHTQERSSAQGSDS